MVAIAVGGVRAECLTPGRPLPSGIVWTPPAANDATEDFAKGRAPGPSVAIVIVWTPPAANDATEGFAEGRAPGPSVAIVTV